jgi:hypothetical protein
MNTKGYMIKRILCSINSILLVNKKEIKLANKSETTEIESTHQFEIKIKPWLAYINLLSILYFYFINYRDNNIYKRFLCSFILVKKIATLVDVLAIVLSRFLTFLVEQPRFFFILEIRQESFLDFTARILPDFQECKILDRTDKSWPASQDCIYMILGWTDKICLFCQESCYRLEQESGKNGFKNVD